MSSNHNRASEISQAIDNGASPSCHASPLSTIQQAIWLEQAIHPDSSNYNIGFFICIEGKLNEALFARAFEKAVHYHDALRLQFTDIHGLPSQKIVDTLPASIVIRDFSSYPDAKAQIKQHIDASFIRQFHLNGALWRTELLRVSQTCRYWQFCCHHLINDGTGLFTLLNNVINAYNCLMKDEPLNWNAFSYLDFVQNERTYLDSQAYSQDLQFWLQRFENPPSPLLYPVHADKTARQGKAENIFWRLDQTMAQRIETIFARQGLPFLYFMYAVIACYFVRTTGTDEIVIGIPVHNRKNARQKRTLGVFVSVIPIRVTVSPEDTLRDVMQKAEAEFNQSYKHQRVPMAEVSRKTHIKQKTGRANLFDIALSIELFNADLHIEGEDAQVKYFELYRGIPPYPLAISVKQYALGLGDDNPPIAIEFNFSTDYLSVEEIAALQSRLAVLLDAALASPDTPIADLPILPEDERQKVLVDFRAPQIDFPQNAVIHQLFETQVKSTPDAIAVVFEDQSLSYDALNRCANRLAHQLIALGVRPDDRVAICAERSLDIVIGLLGILKAGGAYVPLDPTYPAERLAYMLNDSAPVALLIQPATAKMLDNQLSISHIPAIMLEGGKPDNKNQPALDEKSAENPDSQALGLTSHNLAYVIYTSGSTGQPKGVMVEHYGLCNLITTQQKILSLTPGSRLLQFVSNSFDVYIWECCMALLAGSQLYLAKRADILPGATLSHYLETHAITHVFLSPTVLAAMDSIPDTVQVLITGSEVCPLIQVKRWAHGRQMFNGYGPTETTICVTLYQCNDQDKNAPPIGRPIANTQIYILDTNGQPVPIGSTGEIYIGGVGVTRGYLNLPELTQSVFLPDPFSIATGARMYKTGDLARWLPDGNIEYISRNDFQIKLRGYRIELGEIENHLTQCQGVREAVVIDRKDNTGQKRLVAYLLAKPDTKLVPTQLRQQLTQKLADYMIPSAFVTLDTFPQTPNGKLDRQALPEPDQSAIVTYGYDAPVSPAEIALAQSWQALLGLENVSRHDHFFELGGHSLVAVRLTEQLYHLGWRLDIHSVFAAPLLAEMAKSMVIVQDGTTSFTVPPNLIPANCTAITPDMLTLISLTQNEIDAITATVPGGAANIQDIYPLAPLQEGILFHYLLQTQGDTYLLRTLFAFDTRKRLDDFLAALQQVINRHDILRTGICWQGLTHPVQVVWRQAFLPINQFIPDSKEDVLSQLLLHTDPIRHRVDVSQAPLFSADIAYELHQDEWLLSLSFHHLVSDHMTLELIITEINQQLHSRARHHHAHAENSPEALFLSEALPYRNFVAQSLSVPAEIHEAYFREELADVEISTAPFGVLGVLDVHSGGRQVTEASRFMEPALANVIREQARRQGISPTVLFHVAWAQVLAHTSGQNDVVFGTVLLGRMQGNAGIEKIMGLFINTLPVRIPLAGNSVQEILQATHHRLIKLLEHEQAPLVLAQRCSSVPPSQPLFSSLLNYRHTTPGAIHTPLEGVRLLEVRERTNYPIMLCVDDLGEDFSLIAQAVSGIDAKRLIDYMITALTGLVTALDSEPQKPILNISILPATERRQLLVDFNATQTDFPHDALIHQLVEAQVARTPNATALVYGKQFFSYDELNQRANRLAHHLVAQGMHPDERVAICVERNLEMVVGLLAILKAGGAYVPLDFTYPAERLAYMLEDSAPVIVLTQASLAGKLTHHVPTVLIDNFFADRESPIEPQSKNNPDAKRLGLTSHHLAYVIYTSGSTGLPKGVAITHRNTVNFLTWAQRTFDQKALAHTLFATSFSFDLAVYECFAPLISGGTVHIVSDALSLIAAERPSTEALAEKSGSISLINTVPSAIAQLLETDAIPPTVRAVNLAGEALRPHIVEQLFTNSSVQHVCNLYGPSETTTYSTWACMDRATGFVNHIGRPIANTRVYILDTHGQPTPLGVAGEIYIAGAGVARGYLNHPELTTGRFLIDPFSSELNARMYKTGDLGRWLPDGNIEYLGRNDFQVKLRGFRIEPEEIEARLAQCQGVREAIVILREDEPNQKRLVAYLLAEPDTELVPAELHQQLARHLASYMIPCAFVILEAFPLTPNGKLNRKALPVPDQAAIVTHSYEAPAGKLEIALAEIWQTLLGLEKVGRHDHFFELGGHSLLAVQLIARVRQTLSLELSLPQFFANPIFADLATALTKAPSVAQSAIPVADRHQPLPLAFAQQRLWFLACLNPTACLAYQIPNVLRFNGQLNHAAFADALNRLVSRHEGLRTRFLLIDGQPCQHIDAVDTGFALSYHDLRSSDPTVSTATAHRKHLEELVALEAKTPFDFTNEPSIRGQLLQLADEEHVFILTQHHIITDGWSIGILIREMGILYRAALEKQNSPLPPLPIQYADYAVWQQEWLRDDRITAQQNFWREQLRDAPALLALPTDRPRPPEQRYTGGYVPIHLNIGTLDALQSLGQRQDTTLFMTLLAAWGAVLARLSGQDDIVIGIPVANRPHRDLEGVIGFFVNTLPLRIKLENCRTVAQLLSHVREQSLAAYAHQDLPFEQLVENLQPERSLSYSPIFQTMLALNNIPTQSFELPDLTVSLMEQTRHYANFDLTLSLTETNKGLEGYLEYALDLFDRTTIERIAGHFNNVLAAMAADETRDIAHLPMLSIAERRQLLFDFNAPQVNFSPDALIHSYFEAQVQRTPNAAAVVFEDQSLSYHELNCRANQLAHSLIAFGVRPADRVAICVERSLDMIIGLLGILKAGAGYIPLDPAYPTERQIYQLSDSKPVILLTQQHLQQNLQQGTSSIQGLSIWLLDDETHQRRTEKQPEHNPDSKRLGLQPHHLAYIIYTSGSTGHPKGVMVEHRNVVSLIHAQRQVSHPCPEDRILQFVTIAFDISVSDIFPTLASGATLVLRPPHIKVPNNTFIDFLREQAITILNIPTAFWHHWVQEMKSGSCGFSPCLRTVIVGGDKVERRYLTDWLSLPETHSCRWFNAYGPTEITVTASTLLVDDSNISTINDNIPIGRPLSNTCIYILDKFGQPVPIGVCGEIYIGGMGVTRGYSNQPELTAERFIADPFSKHPNARMYKTGDLARWRLDGNIEYLGRNDFQVKIRGFRIELGEIEARLLQCCGVREAIVLARQDFSGHAVSAKKVVVSKNIEGEKRLVAYLLAEPNVKLTPAKLRQQLAQHLAEYMLPSAFVILDAFPLAPNGKIDRQALPMPDQTALVTRAYAPPTGSTEMTLAEIWQALLGLDKVSRYDHFFELGGHSLMIVNLIERLRNQGLVLDIRTVFASPVLADMAKAVRARNENPRLASVPPNLIPDGCNKITPDMLPLVALTQCEIDAIAATVPGGAANIQDIYPLAPLQEGMLFHHLLQTQGDIYLLHLMLTFDTRERLDAFLAAFQQTIDRHDILRTAICWQNLSQPVQVVWRQASLRINAFVPDNVPDNMADGDKDVQSQLKAYTDPRCHRLDVTQAPLFSTDIAYDPHQGKWLLALCSHHIINDHVSLDLITTEIHQLLYPHSGQLSLGDSHSTESPSAPQFSPLLPYRDFIGQSLRVPASEHKAYFHEVLSDVDTPTAPFGILDIYSSDKAVTEAIKLLNASLSREIRKQARRHGVSPGVLFHVAWAQVVAKLSGRNDVVFGTVLLGRMQSNADITRTPGLFINTLPIRIRLGGNSVQTTVQATYRSLTQLLEHEQASLALAQSCSGVKPPLPLFTALLNYRHSPSDTTRNTWEGIELLTARERTNYPLYMAVDDLGKGFRLAAQTVQHIEPERVLAHMTIALTGLVQALETEPESPIADIPVLSITEHRQLQIDFPQEPFISAQSMGKSHGHEDPIGDIEASLVKIWQQLLKQDQISRHDNFFTLGGNSLLAIQLLARMHEQGMQIPLAALFIHPTLCELAEIVAGSFS
ncbi:Amino acid adenylation [Xenorhabdus mauleonii]|uniref:Amino acid adenylation n=1 Tax=Xenorhabdus mauleonii TaxID=351675 RepID=A0A1I3J5A4_9GAMM|nr:non-ribosomal peptide synthetase [Xenorhabdus mauleonii]PHM46101.1 Amino acid adenylation [Xenorhabdus mauleonii]SFI55452.1 amino acid adenylation domain-containing protein [Xenorhabdus mauleonii]